MSCVFAALSAARWARRCDQRCCRAIHPMSPGSSIATHPVRSRPSTSAVRNRCASIRSLSVLDLTETAALCVQPRSVMRSDGRCPKLDGSRLERIEDRLDVVSVDVVSAVALDRSRRGRRAPPSDHAGVPLHRAGRRCRPRTGATAEETDRLCPMMWTLPPGGSAS